MNDLFAAAPTVQSQASTPGAIPVGDALDILDAIDTITASLSSVREYYEGELKKEVRPQYIAKGMELHCQPNNLSLESPGGAKCTAVWSRRGANSPLSADEEKILKSHGIPVDEVTVTPAVEERYFFSQEILDDPALRQKISEALGQIPELAGKPILLRQAPVEAKTKRVVSDGAINQMFAKVKKGEDVSKLLRIVSFSKFNVRGEGNLAASFNTLEKMGLGELVNRATKKTKKA